MNKSPKSIDIYHITDLENLSKIQENKGLLSDAAIAKKQHTVIGYDHIKNRRLTELHVPCCNNRFVGEFVPFYFCPRAPMLYVINKGGTGRAPGCQQTVLHLVSTAAEGIQLGGEWALSDGNREPNIPSFAPAQMHSMI